MKTKNKVKRASELPATDIEICHRSEIEHSEAISLHTEICSRISSVRDSIAAHVNGIKDDLNACRAIGELILKEEEKLPGKQITFDFYMQQKKSWVDPQGRPISFDNLKHFKKIAASEASPVDNIIRALSWKNEMLGFIGVSAEGKAPGRDPVERQNHFVLLTRELPRLAQIIGLHVTAIESDPHFGRLENLSEDKAGIIRKKIKDARIVLDDLERRLPHGA